jgi:serine/threonine protein kinase
MKKEKQVGRLQSRGLSVAPPQRNASVKTEPDALLGEVIDGKYRLVERLDQTGHARVYRAEQVHVGRPVALKVEPRALNKQDPAWNRLSRTARLAARVKHPHVAEVYDVGIDDARGHVYLAMEMCPGENLRDHVLHHGPLTVEQTVGMGRQILQGLKAAHAKNVVHGSLSPKYILLSTHKTEGSTQPRLRIKLVGFGLADWEQQSVYHKDGGTGEDRSQGGAQRVNTRQGGVHQDGTRQGDAPQGDTRQGDAQQGGGGIPYGVTWGTAGFAAPEVLSGGLTDVRSDYYSVAVCLFYAMTGQVPWEAGVLDMEEARRWYAHRVRWALENIKGTDGWVDFFQTALAPRSPERFDSADGMVDALKRAATGKIDEGSQISQRRETFGRFRLVRMLARGGMGELHLATTDLETGEAQAVALKTLRQDLTAQKEFLALFLEEAKLTSRLVHPNLVRVYEVGKVDERYYISLEYVVGKDCRRILERARTDRLPIPIEVAVLVVRELCEGLAYAHRIVTPSGYGLVHADVSPTNVMVSFEGAVKLIDFGLAGRVEMSTQIERNQLMGKLHYLSPEQLLDRPMDNRTDLYAAGLVLFELLTGQRYHRGETIHEVVEWIEKGKPIAPSAVDPRVPEVLDGIVARALERDPDKRYRHAEALRDDLAEVLSRLRPRMSRDVVAGYLRQIFPSEYRADTQLSHSLFTRTPQPAAESAIQAQALESLSDIFTDGEETTLPALSLADVEATKARQGRRKTLKSPVYKAEDDFDATAETLAGARLSEVAEGEEIEPTVVDPPVSPIGDTDPGLKRVDPAAVDLPVAKPNPQAEHPAVKPIDGRSYARLWTLLALLVGLIFGVAGGVYLAGGF